MTTSALKPDGKSHRLLRALARGPMYFKDLQQVLGPRTNSESRKAWYVITTLRRGGLIECWSAYSLTEAGEEALRDLDDGLTVWIGAAQRSVRVFVQGRAA